ncbi:MAG: dTDP-4-dehydrorhamnose reductase [Microcoleus sp. PH2017_10_PVI_O_A]|uniref:dTDP-4-dehydrorhamnose reductase n=1 Tax=unclassified Microcoleus TaxID=2642155 RepID=UPI001D37A176|nr:MULTISPECIES: dTDP-4-dehydrorhamnose reductase [unclassified Microcoleus]TAE82200.1 MAG: dTDP-4-dehydrorhamnose reductase [Oscillatoriales cyanobacterium]MCC3406450.1 dTDP-4-dehydrorhamnose reductase [Microcoleus sp. PH2017_10_PVI_O_A]MCC3459077.1 dTDP-4-dehydrorhamnose reductase [Microcoleus sp. PH2017_11_PCY_U_A]MCC3478971.1 dTDP-4-dehydrorhamnose reductase [Microcoleus sp. PH2017_12_PCY_D_A]MCC3529220.1 dTDP-4-dehydrorhamnose reductase [Microcoleus sp. PH2017_21_RUC_O_A]
MKILLAGGSGQLAQELQPILLSSGDVIAVDRTSVDLSQPETIRQAMADIQPDVVVNAAAYTAVDKAESEAQLARAVNGIAPGIFAEECEKLGASLIHFSTDYVFDGSSGSAYLETDSTNPLGIYGESKLAGEEAIRKAGNRHIIIRTAWVYGNGGKGNFVKTMLRLGKDREEIRVVADQIGSPTWTADLAAATSQIIPNLGPESFGTYQYTNSGVCSWYDFAIAIFEEAEKLGFPLKIKRVIPITTAEYPTPAKRPAFSVLSTVKISALLGTYPPHWRQGLRKMLAREINQF